MPKEITAARRRGFVTDAGEQLLVTGDPFAALDRFITVAEALGLSPAHLVTSPLLAVPVPRYPDDSTTRPRWPGVDTAALWHPLLWLPPRLAYAYTLQHEDGSQSTESTDAWAARVGMELTEAGLYDPDDATWVDVLDLYDLDVTNPDHRHRIVRWQLGGDDAILDQIDLSGWLDDPDDPHWALTAVTAQLPDLYAVMWALHADALMTAVNELAAPFRQIEVQELTDKGDLIAEVAQVSFSAMPSSTNAPERDFWSAVGGEHTGGAQRYLDTILAAMHDRLETTRTSYWPRLEQLGTPSYT